MGAAPPAAAVVKMPSVAVRVLLLSTLCATSVAIAGLLKVIEVGVPNAVPSTVGSDPSGAAARPLKVMFFVPLKL